MKLFSGDLDRASAAFGNALVLASRSGYHRTTVEAVLGLAAVAAARGLDKRALRLCSAAVAAGRRDELRLVALHQQVVATVRAQTASIDADSRETIAEYARQTPLERIVTEALSLAAPSAPDAVRE
jgi:hypothetical protein